MNVVCEKVVESSNNRVCSDIDGTSILVNSEILAMEKLVILCLNKTYCFIATQLIQSLLSMLTFLPKYSLSRGYLEATKVGYISMPFGTSRACFIGLGEAKSIGESGRRQ